jgi:hypothetical protein
MDVEVPQTLTVSTVMMLVGNAFTVTFTVSLQLLMPLLTVTIYEVVAVGVTVIDDVVAPVDQR